MNPSTISSVNVKINMKIDTPSVVVLNSHVNIDHVCRWLDQLMEATDLNAHPGTVEPHWTMMLEDPTPHNCVCFSDLLGQAYQWEIRKSELDHWVIYPILDDLTRVIVPQLLNFFGGSVWWFGPIPQGESDLRVDTPVFDVRRYQDAAEAVFEQLLMRQAALGVADMTPPNEYSAVAYIRLVEALNSLDRRKRLMGVAGVKDQRQQEVVVL